MILLPRRRFLLAAPALIGAASLMRLSSRAVPPPWYGNGVRDDAPNLNWQLRQPGTMGPNGQVVGIVARNYHLFQPARIERHRDTFVDFNGASLFAKTEDAAIYVDTPGHSVSIANVISHCFAPAFDRHPGEIALTLGPYNYSDTGDNQ